MTEWLHDWSDGALPEPGSSPSLLSPPPPTRLSMGRVGGLESDIIGVDVEIG